MESKEKIIQMFIDELIEYSLQEHKQKQMSEEEREEGINRQLYFGSTLRQFLRL